MGRKACEYTFPARRTKENATGPGKSWTGCLFRIYSLLWTGWSGPAAAAPLARPKRGGERPSFFSFRPPPASSRATTKKGGLFHERKFLAALLALVMVFSMIPVSASAAETVQVTGDEPITTNDRSVSFHLYTTQLYKLIMLEDDSATADSDVSGVSLLLHDGFGVLVTTELSLRKIGGNKSRN